MKLDEERRHDHQKELEKKHREEASARFAKEKPRQTSLPSKEMAIEAYKDPSKFPHEAQKFKIFVDTQRESILVPIYGFLVPFHILTIKNVSKTDEEHLRIIFNVPANDQTKIQIRELTYRSTDSHQLNNALRMIKELRKRVAAREADRVATADLVVQETLIETKGRSIPRLTDVFIRPNPTGRRTIGTLEAHVNGFRFISQRGEHIDVLYKNIKIPFFQPAENEVLVLIHFRLKNAIMVGKKKTEDVQFCTEVMEVSQALDSRHRYDVDEIEDEQRERQNRNRLNNEFQNFFKRVEDLPSGLEFDIPYRELGFQGVPNRSSVLLQPTVHCLVNLTEQPFFVLVLDEIEIAYFERVQFSLRNFDLVFVLKDYDKPVVHVNSIAVEYLETIKEWLDSCDIKYYEGTQTLNWNRIMSAIKEDPVRFHTEEGGWSFLNTESSSEEEQENEDGEANDKNGEEEESDYAPEDGSDENEEENEEEDEEEYEENSEEDSDEDEDSAENSDDGSEEEAGEDWDELEKKARKEDKERAQKRAKRGREDDFSGDSEEEEERQQKKKKNDHHQSSEKLQAKKKK